MKFKHFEPDDRIPPKKQKQKKINKKKNAGNTKHLISRFEGHTKIASYDIVVKATSTNKATSMNAMFVF